MALESLHQVQAFVRLLQVDPAYFLKEYILWKLNNRKKNELYLKGFKAEDTPLHTE